MASAIPKGYHTVTPYIVVRKAAQAIEFYEKAFGAQELSRMLGPDGKNIVHAEIKIGDSLVMISDENPQWDTLGPESRGGPTGSLMIYVTDVDAAFDRALKAGAKLKMPLTDMFWGDRFGQLLDPFGHEWGMATHKEDLTDDQIRERAKEFYASMATQA